MPDISDIVARCQQHLEAGNQPGEIVLYLHDSGVPMVDAVKAVRALYAISLAEADFRVRSHPAWSEEAILSAHLTAQFVQLFEEN